jgi:hypothetical protein
MLVDGSVNLDPDCRLNPSSPGGPYGVHRPSRYFEAVYLHGQLLQKLRHMRKRRIGYRASCHCLKHGSMHKCLSQRSHL